jgi:peptidoglycan/xylan/chitin deacetylase (PgdA/CDA1 family)
MEVGSHGMLHRDLRLLTEKDLMLDLVESKSALESITGTECRVFAYPFGLFTEREEAAVQRAGYQMAFAWGRSGWRRFSVPRIPAPSRYGGWALALRLGLDGVRPAS